METPVAAAVMSSRIGRPPINDGLTKQRRWQIKQQALGRCQECGGTKPSNCTQCDACAETTRVRMREERGFKAWQPGGSGRKPKHAVTNQVT